MTAKRVARTFLESADTPDVAWKIASIYAEKMRALRIVGQLISVRKVRRNFWAVEVVTREPVTPSPPDNAS